MVESLLEYLDEPSVHVLAHDIGDTVAQELIARHISRQREGGLTGDSCKIQSLLAMSLRFACLKVGNTLSSIATQQLSCMLCTEDI